MGGFLKIFAVFVVALMFSLSAASAEGKKEAEEKEKKETKLEEIVVTATKTEKELEYVPAAVNVVSKKEIEQRAVKTIDDVLNNYSGVYVHRTRKVQDTPTDSVSLRGIPGNRRNLILIDGIQLNDPQGGTLKFAGIKFEDVEKIEIVRGPFSSLYGGMAMGGVVNIITKLPEKRELVFKTGFGSGFERGKALDDLRKIYISYGDRLLDNKLSIFLSYGYEAANGFSSTLAVSRIQPPAALSGWTQTTDTAGEPRFLIGDSGDHRGYNGGLRFKIGYDFDEKTNINLSFLRIYANSSYDDPHTYLRNSEGSPVWGYGVPPNAVNQSAFLAGSFKKEINMYSLNFEKDFSPLKMKVSMGIHDSNMNRFTTPCVGSVTGCAPTAFASVDKGAGITHNTPAESYNFDALFTLPLFQSHILTFGGSYKQAKTSTKEYDLSNWKDADSKTNFRYETRGKERGYSLFLQDEIILRQNLTAYLGLRYDWWETFDGYENDAVNNIVKKYPSRDDSYLSPKISIIYKPYEKTTLRASIGKAFRPPMAIELYRKFMTPGSFVYGNPALKPESTTSWDIGIGQKLWKGADIKVAYFENYMKDLIYSRDTGQRIGTRSIVETVNAGKAESKGVEIEVGQRLNEMMRVFGNFTYTNAEIKDNPAKPATQGKKLTGIPETMFNIGAELEKGPFSASLIGRYRGKAYNNDENKDRVNNVYGSYDPYFIADAKITYKLTNYANLSVSVDNIFNREYYYFYKQPGRSWFVELSMRF